jgi:hypothetical protein
LQFPLLFWPPYFLPWTRIAGRVSDHALNDGASNCIEILVPIMESIQGLWDFSASLFDLLYRVHPPLSNHRRSGTNTGWKPGRMLLPANQKEVPNIAPSAVFLETSTPIVWRSRKIIRKNPLHPRQTMNHSADYRFSIPA